MFSYVRGVVKQAGDQALTVDVAGVGFYVVVADPQVYQPGKEVTVFVHMQWNQEQGPTLYGFSQEQEKSVFLLITSCSGIGPKIAMLVLQKLSPVAFLRAIQTADIKTLSAISGIGPKKAEQLIVQLKHKVTALLDKGWSNAQGEDAQHLQEWKNISQVLQSLHYSSAEIDRALSHIAQENVGKELPFDGLMRKALSFLAKKV